MKDKTELEKVLDEYFEKKDDSTKILNDKRSVSRSEEKSFYCGDYEWLCSRKCQEQCNVCKMECENDF